MDPETEALRAIIVPLVEEMWDEFVRKSPDKAAAAKAAVRPEFCIGRSGWTKLTMALDNPSPVHHDRGNLAWSGVFELCSDDLEWGDHVIMDNDNVYMFKPRSGTLFLGPYKFTRHGNLATAKGGRWICTAYVSIWTLCGGARGTRSKCDLILLSPQVVAVAGREDMPPRPGTPAQP